MTYTLQNLINCPQLSSGYLKCIRYLLVPDLLQLQKQLTKIFKMIFNTVESLHNRNFFYSGCIKTLGCEKKFLIITKLIKISVKKKAVSISTFGFTTLYATIPHKLLVKVLSEVINFFIKYKVRKSIGLSKTTSHWISKGAGRKYLSKQTFYGEGNISIKNTYTCQWKNLKQYSLNCIKVL